MDSPSDYCYCYRYLYLAAKEERRWVSHPLSGILLRIFRNEVYTATRTAELCAIFPHCRPRADERSADEDVGDDVKLEEDPAAKLDGESSDREAGSTWTDSKEDGSTSAAPESLNRSSAQKGDIADGERDSINYSFKNEVRLFLSGRCENRNKFCMVNNLVSSQIFLCRVMLGTIHPEMRHQ